MKKELFIVGIDGSECSVRAVERAVNLAKRLEASVLVVNVLQVTCQQPMIAEGFVAPTVEPELAEQEAMKRVISPLIERLKSDNLNMDGVVVWGEPVEVLHEMVKKKKASMLFLGRRGRSSFVDMILGSVANKLAHHSGIPVVLVP